MSAFRQTEKLNYLIKSMHPYDDDYVPTNYELFKSIVLAPVALVRVLWIALNYGAIYLLASTCSEPVVRKVIPYFGRSLLLGFGYLHVPVRNKHWMEDALDINAVAVYNHISPLDGFVLTSYVHPFSAVVNSVHGSMAIMRPIVEKLRYILVDFNNRGLGQTVKLVNHINDNNKKDPEERNILAIAPEGSTTNGKVMLTFRTGAFVPLAPVLPILIRYPYRYASPAWTRTSITKTMYRLLTQFVNFAEIVLMPVMTPYQGEKPQDYAARVQSEMARQLNIPISNLTRSTAI